MPGTLRTERTASYNQTVGVRLDIDDAIDILTPSDVPLQQWAGSNPTDQTKVEWLEEDLTPQHFTATSKTGTGPWVITVPNGESEVVRVGDVLWQKDGAHTLQYLVTASDDTANTVTVSGFAGNATGPVDGSVMEVIGQYLVEGGDPLAPRSIERTTNYNYTQVAQEQVSVTRTARKRGLYGQGDPYDHEVMKKFKELAIRFERSMANGVRVQSGDAKQRMMGGLFYFLSTNSESGVKANAATLVNGLMKKVYEQGGGATTLMVSPAVKVALSTIDASLRQTTRSDTVGGYVVERVLTDFGTADVVVNRHFPKTKGLLLQQEYITKRPFDAYFHELLAKTGDSEKGELVGEYSLEVKNEKAHGTLTITDA